MRPVHDLPNKASQRPPRITLWALAAFILVVFSLTPLIGTTAIAAESSAETLVDEVHAQEPALTEQQVREALVKILLGNNATQHAQSSDDENTTVYDGDTFAQWQEDGMAHSLAGRLHQLKSKNPILLPEIKKAFLQTTGPEHGFTWTKVVFTIGLACVLGLLLEYLTTRKLLTHLNHYVDKQEKTNSLKFKYTLLRLAIQILGFLALFVVAYACELMSLYGNPYYESLHTLVLKALILFRIGETVCRNVFSPNHKDVRLVNLDCKAATALYYWFICYLLVKVIGQASIDYLYFSDIEQLLVTGLLVPFSLALNGVIIIGAWMFKRQIDLMFIDSDENLSHRELVKKQGFAAQVFIQIWPALFTAWMLGIWGTWLYNSLVGLDDAAVSVGIAWWITLIFPTLDRVVHAILKNFSQIKWLQSPHFQRRSTVFRHVIQTSFRIVAFFGAIITVSSALGFQTGFVSMAMGTERLWRIVDLLVTLGLVYIVWTVMSAYIERKLPVGETALASLEGDAGGAGATRGETLLPLIRTTLNVVFFIFLVLSALHSMGISIAPILAGAGVVGIAVGFGAQKLVQDILSGMFFLIDDAFRRGEYIEVENLRGSVEQISLRSMQLRHHLGAVQTIPYGEIKTVRNLSRDWVTMKLELRLPYETDIEKVRKIIKKTGQQMLEHEEWGDNFILPLKSQGVMRVDDSALIVRMKFTSRPGEQWVIRREAYRLVRDALEAEGIHFARREVRVLLPEVVAATDKPDSETDSTHSPNLIRAAGAAAMSVLAAEAVAKAKQDDAGDGDERD